MRKLFALWLTLQVCAFAADKKHAPLPDKLVNAKTVFLQNDTGEQKLLDHVYAQINKRGVWNVVTDRSKADIILILNHQESMAGTVSVGSATAIGNSAYGVGTSVPVTDSSYYSHIVDSATGEQLWTGKKTITVNSWTSVAKALLPDIKKQSQQDSPPVK